MSQLNFNFKHIPAFGRKDFIVTNANTEAVQWLDKWPNWPNKSLLVYGDKGSGKTHLIHSWKLMAKGVVLDSNNLKNISFENLYHHNHIAIDDASKISDDTLFHLINIFNESNKTIFLTDRLPPSKWSTCLPDLKSRLRSILTIELKKPDDKLIYFLLVKLFNDRQLNIDNEVINYLVKRVERNFIGIQNIVNLIDNQSFSKKKRITIPFVAKILNKET